MYSVFEGILYSEGAGGLKKYLENGKSWGVGGSYVKFSPWWGYGYFLEPHNNKGIYYYISHRSNYIDPYTTHIQD